MILFVGNILRKHDYNPTYLELLLEDLKHYATRHTHLSIALATTQNIKTMSAIGGITEQTAPGYTKHGFHLMTKKRSFDINDNDELDIVKSIIKKND